MKKKYNLIMKKMNIKSFVVAICMIFGSTVFAQTTIDVAPGLGTLEAAIEANGGDVIYHLEAGAWYGLTSIIEVSDTTMGEGKGLVIVGEETDGMPAILQVGTDDAGSVFPALFNIFNDLTIHNVFLVAQDYSGIAGAGVISMGAKVRVEVDNVTIDPAGTNFTFRGGDPAAGSSIFVTNSLIMRNGHMAGPNDGGLMAAMNAMDTIYWENNTVASSGQDFIGSPFHGQPNTNFIFVNHNTFLWHDVWLKKSYNDENIYIANNIFHDFSIFAQLYAWGQFFPDYQQGNEMLSLVAVDTLELPDGAGLESLPSERIAFWNSNLQYNSEGMRSLPTFARDNEYGPIYHIPMMWDEDAPDYYASDYPVEDRAPKSRDARIFADDENFPHFKFDHNHYDLDPGYTDARIYDISDNAGEHIIGWFSKLIFGVEGAAEVEDLPSYMWDVDGWAGTDPADYPVVWPRWDGSYTNETLHTASVGGYPLGDLNAFPEHKALWEARKGDIMDHILALNTEQIALSVNDIKALDESFRMYPNPTKDRFRIESKNTLNNVKIYSTLGQLVKVKHLDGLNADVDISNLSKGMYFVEVNYSKGIKITTRIIKE